MLQQQECQAIWCACWATSYILLTGRIANNRQFELKKTEKVHHTQWQMYRRKLYEFWLLDHIKCYSQGNRKKKGTAIATQKTSYMEMQRLKSMSYTKLPKTAGNDARLACRKPKNYHRPQGTPKFCGENARRDMIYGTTSLSRQNEPPLLWMPNNVERTMKAASLVCITTITRTLRTEASTF